MGNPSYGAEPSMHVGLAAMLYPLNHRLKLLIRWQSWLYFLYCFIAWWIFARCECAAVTTRHYLRLHPIFLMTVTVLILCFTCILLAPVSPSSESQFNCDWRICLYHTHAHTTLYRLYALVPPLSNGHAWRELDWTDSFASIILTQYRYKQTWLSLHYRVLKSSNHSSNHQSIIESFSVFLDVKKWKEE